MAPDFSKPPRQRSTIVLNTMGDNAQAANEPPPFTAAPHRLPREAREEPDEEFEKFNRDGKRIRW